MKIQEVLKRHYKEFLDMLKNQDVIVYKGKTSEDILNDAMITVIRHYGDMEVEEEEAFEYAKKTFLMEETFAFKKKDPNLFFISDYPKNL